MIKVISFRPLVKNTLRGFVTLKLTNVGLEIKDCVLHEKEGKRWINFPARPYEDEKGNRQWVPVLKIDEDKNRLFQREAVAALNAFLAQAGQSGGGTF